MAVALPIFLEGKVWKLGMILVGALSLVLTVLLTMSYFENNNLIKQRTAIMDTINNPDTGYIAQLAQSRTNARTLTSVIAEQKASFETKAAQREAVLAATSAQLARAQAETRDMERKVGSFLATKPKGVTLEDRINDIDRRALKELVE